MTDQKLTTDEALLHTLRLLRGEYVPESLFAPMRAALLNLTAKGSLPLERIIYHMNEVIGCYDELHSMPSASLRQRLTEACARAWAEQRKHLHRDGAVKDAMTRLIEVQKKPKQHWTAGQLKIRKEMIRDQVDKLEGTGKYHGDMSNICYGDGYFANSLLRETGCKSIEDVKRWLGPRTKSKRTKK